MECTGCGKTFTEKDTIYIDSDPVLENSHIDNSGERTEIKATLVYKYILCETCHKNFNPDAPMMKFPECWNVGSYSWKKTQGE